MTEIRWYKGVGKVRIVKKGLRKGKKGPLTYEVEALEPFKTRLSDKEEHYIGVGLHLISIPRLLWKKPRK
jgi:hypothetical protein